MDNKNTVEKVVCSVCFRTHTNTAKNKPARHGFNIVGAHRGHGLQGAWHTGPCMGWEYPHFGISSEGTQAALKIVTAQLESTKAHLANLATRPDLTWYEERSKYSRRTEPLATVVLTPGTARQYGTAYSVPSYDEELASRVFNATQRKEQEERAITEYTAAIASWKPAKPVKAAKPAPVIHLQANWKRSTHLTSSCQAYAMTPNHIPSTRLTTDKTLVTCQRCK